MASNSTLKVLIITFLLAAVIRFINLSSLPVSLTIDEVEIGYNAFSLLKTGKDAWGIVTPLAFRSIGDYKPPVNIYLAVPFVLISGLSEFSVRAPVAILGSLAAPLLICLCLLLRLPKKAAYYSGISLALLPWHWHFSRASFEAVSALTFFIIFLCTFLISLRNRSTKNLVVSLVFAALSIWSYHSTRFFTPLFAIVLFITFRKRLFNLFKRKHVKALSLLTFTISLGPFILLALFTPAVRQRAAMTSILRDTPLVLSLHNHHYESFADRVFDSDLYSIFHHWGGKYSDYFDFRFWFFKGMSFTPPGYPDSGLMYLVDLPLFIAGLFVVSKIKNKFLIFILVIWFFTGPLAASFTMNDQHPLRALIWSPFFTIIIGLGFHRLLLTKNKILIFAYITLLIGNFMFVYDLYSKAYPRFFSEYWQYGFKDIALFACNEGRSYNKVVISETFGSLGPLNTGIPESYVLFYCRINPSEFQKNKQILNISFSRVSDSYTKQPNHLLISAPWDYLSNLPPEKAIVKKINFLNGDLAFLFVDTNLIQSSEQK